MSSEPTTLDDFCGESNPGSNHNTQTADQADTNTGESSPASTSSTANPPSSSSETSTTADTDTTDTDDEEGEDAGNEEAFPWESPSEVPVPDDAGVEVRNDEDIPLEKMALDPFPDPEDITRLVENREVDGRGGLPDESLIDPEQGVFLTLTAYEVYDYLVTLQKKTDHWLNNEIKYNLQRQVIGQSHGMTENLKLEHYDKKWLAYAEKERRMESDTYEWEAVPDSRGWQELPNDPDAEWNTTDSDGGAGATATD